jgi:hypothetical protein
MLRQSPPQVGRKADVKPIVLRGMQKVDVEHPLFLVRQPPRSEAFYAAIDEVSDYRHSKRMKSPNSNDESKLPRNRK